MTMDIKKNSFNRTKFRNRVAGCWLGKNIGGTLGAPFECTREILDLKFYAQKLNGNPAPNDDLDLQLLWLEMAERVGIDRLTPRVFGEFWLDFVTAGWNEYGVACGNMQNGFFPPLSGCINNEKWKLSNGAWIRSELWGCIAPGSPEQAARLAWMDASADHESDGIYAEIFTSVLESMAFVQSDLKKLIADALEFLPPDCRIFRAVRQAVDLYNANIPWREARNAVVEANADTGFFQAPQNIAFTILGLLYGEGDFERTLLAAVNCGDDTDCTGATAGAIMGILLGEEGIPERWKAPIGRGIRNVSIDIMHNNIAIPANLDELTSRTVALAEEFQRCDPRLPAFTDGDDVLPVAACFPVSESYRSQVIARDQRIMELPLGSGILLATYPDGAEIAPSGSLRIVLGSNNFNICRLDTAVIRFQLPQGWSISPANEVFLRKSPGSVEITLTAPEHIAGAVTQIVLEVRSRGRNYPEYTVLPVQTRGAAIPAMEGPYWFGGRRERLLARQKHEMEKIQ